MARPLEFKARVRLPAELSLPAPRAPRRLDLRFVGALTWLTASAIAYLVVTRGVPSRDWLGGAAGGAARGAVGGDAPVPPARVTPPPALAASEPEPGARAAREPHRAPPARTSEGVAVAAST
ncbi:MAG: hypothetical protein OZ921_04970, partial [Sorangiineae bacterium]|nr:hypothetical protein [Sorangiineae bacterium]